ncbi:MAG: site-2 protease family protein [Clostridia bacterium]|nr:site-2 protease family protein [Clostridia bacterium]
MLSFLLDFIRGDLKAIDLIVYVLSITYVCLCATPLHEFAHAFVAVKLGDDTPRLRGRVTINPMAHVDPLGILMIFLFGFGYAKPVEVRMRNFKKPKRDMAIVALAGPLSNFLQAFVYLLISAVLSVVLVFTGIAPLEYICMFFTFAALINIRLGVFNMIPVPPLDGSRLLTALLPAKAYFKIMQYERYISIGLMLLLFTGVLSTPLAKISEFIYNIFEFIIFLPFSFIG